MSMSLVRLSKTLSKKRNGSRRKRELRALIRLDQEHQRHDDNATQALRPLRPWTDFNGNDSATLPTQEVKLRGLRTQKLKIGMTGVPCPLHQLPQLEHHSALLLRLWRRPKNRRRAEVDSLLRHPWMKSLLSLLLQAAVRYFLNIASRPSKFYNFRTDFVHLRFIPFLILFIFAFTFLSLIF